MVGIDALLFLSCAHNESGVPRLAEQLHIRVHFIVPPIG